MIGEIIGETIFYLILNTIGGTIRWIYGSIWRSIFNKPKFSFKEYLYGPKKSKEYWDQHLTMNNGIVGFIVIIVIIAVLV
ncbi:hypothetical protein Q4509_05315 [Oceanihabitans sp. 1_MG-2023]|uniref:hypothetical protein n=1 Tax=Flavobacteriaceae TaxID=49546 RepID=UPI001C08FF9F|nr:MULTISPECIES: hypothetical protein [Flavobacteriaceae]MDO6622272.1 hypothetical protein [Oceanihabitans sp. 1_MG-2023]